MDPFEPRQIGQTAVTVPAFGIGTAPLGRGPSTLPDEQAIRTLRHAWERGIRYFDTAPYYGAGRAEERLGRAFADVDRDELVLSTKVGRVLKPAEAETSRSENALEPVFDFSPDGVAESLTASRERLGFDEIDIALIHDPDDHYEQALEEAYPDIARRKATGEFQAIGVGMNWAEPLTQFAKDGDFDCFLLAGRYTLLEQDALDNLLPEVERQGASIIAGGVFNSGLLVDPKPGATYNYAPAPAEILEQAQALQAACNRHDVPLRAAALQFPLSHDAITTIIVGVQRPEEVDDNLEMLQRDIPAELWDDLRAEGMIRPDAPVPAET